MSNPVDSLSTAGGWHVQGYMFGISVTHSGSGFRFSLGTPVDLRDGIEALNKLIEDLNNQGSSTLFSLPLFALKISASNELVVGEKVSVVVGSRIAFNLLALATLTVGGKLEGTLGKEVETSKHNRTLNLLSSTLSGTDIEALEHKLSINGTVAVVKLQSERAAELETRFSTLRTHIANTQTDITATRGQINGVCESMNGTVTATKGVNTAVSAACTETAGTMSAVAGAITKVKGAGQAASGLGVAMGASRIEAVGAATDAAALQSVA